MLNNVHYLIAVGFMKRNVTLPIIRSIIEYQYHYYDLCSPNYLENILNSQYLGSIVNIWAKSNILPRCFKQSSQTTRPSSPLSLCSTSNRSICWLRSSFAALTRSISREISALSATSLALERIRAS